LAELQLKELKGARYPVFSARTSYTISNSSAELGFATKTEGRGFNYGIVASMNIFNGFRQRRNEQNSKLLIEQSELSLERINSIIEAQVASAYQTYLTSLKLAALEERNVIIAKENLDITLEKFNIGTIAPIEYREAQRNYTEAAVRYNDSRYEAKIAEVALKQISGTLDFF
jgi:outer membrane protein TolC